MGFQYKVTVIVPVYNVEKYLGDCLDSLVAQTIDHRQMEVLLINDGSTDNSLAICQKYARQHDFFTVFSKKNEGVSAARNFGIRNANGKYIMYLDADDTITENTVKTVTDFFDVVYDQVDLVTYQEIGYYYDGTARPLHFRYAYLKNTDVYDLTKTVFATQVRLNCAVKNLFHNNFYFNEKIGYHEDQMYCTEILSRKLLLGYVTGCRYHYNIHPGSITAENTNAIFLFEKTTSYWEYVFSCYEKVPQYLQALFFHDMSWKLKTNCLFPYHYEESDYKKAMSRLSALLDLVDDDIILTCPSTDNYHRHFFLNMKTDRNKATVISGGESILVYKKGNLLYKSGEILIILNALNVFGDELYISAHLKSPVFNYIEAPKVVAVITAPDGNVSAKELEISISPDSYYHTKEKTNNFYAFLFNCKIQETASIEFKVIVDDVFYNCHYWFMPSAPYSDAQQKYKAIFDRCIVNFHANFFYIEQVNENIVRKEREKANALHADEKNVYRIRSLADALRKKRIWLYYDCQGVEKDNGYYQFCHDFGMADGIERYYINANGRNLNRKLFSRRQLAFVVDFGSEKHKALYLAAQKIITAYIENRNIVPFENKEMSYYCDIAHAQIIYLQHGILHAHLPWKYAPGRILADKIVVSSHFELENFTETYNFRKKDLIAVGMPRFDHIKKNISPKRRMLFAPSWRSYLIEIDQCRGWIPSADKFMKSEYFKNFNGFLNSKKLENFLAEKDLYIDFKIHPIFAPYLGCFEKNNSRVCFAGKSVKDEEYAVFITDFSSFVFDFAYLKRPIMYFVPDMIQFKSGMNQYRKLDLPFEKAFGKLTTEPEAAVQEVVRIIDNDFIPDKEYKDRMDSFFLPLENCSEKLYQYLMGGK